MCLFYLYFCFTLFFLYCWFQVNTFNMKDLIKNVH